MLAFFSAWDFRLIAVIVGTVLAWWLASFVAWRALRIDYSEEKIVHAWIKLSTLGIIAGVGGQAVVGRGWGFGAFPAMVGVIAGLWLLHKRGGWDVWEWVDVIGLVGLGLSAAVGLLWDWQRWWLWSGIMVLGVGVGKWVGRSYRNFRWYKSGKPGLTGLVCLLWWLAAQIAVEILTPGEIYWGNSIVKKVLLGCAFLAVILKIYLRSGTKR